MKEECKCGILTSNRNCPYHFPITSQYENTPVDNGIMDTRTNTLEIKMNTPTEPVLEDWAQLDEKLEKLEKCRNYLGMVHTGQNQYDEGGKVWLEYQVDIDIAEKEYSEAKQQLKAFIRQTRLDLLNEIEGEIESKIRDVGDDTVCNFCGEYKVCGDCDCTGVNKGLQVGVDIIRSKMD